MSDGAVNIGAFLAHVFCVACKTEVVWNDLEDIEVEENGADIAVAWHGSCPGCGKIYMLEISDQDDDTPIEVATTRSASTEAEKIAAFNRRGIAR